MQLESPQYSIPLPMPTITRQLLSFIFIDIHQVATPYVVRATSHMDHMQSNTAEIQNGNQSASLSRINHKI